MTTPTLRYLDHGGTELTDPAPFRVQIIEVVSGVPSIRVTARATRMAAGGWTCAWDIGTPRATATLIPYRGDVRGEFIAARDAMRVYAAKTG